MISLMNKVYEKKSFNGVAKVSRKITGVITYGLKQENIQKKLREKEKQSQEPKTKSYLNAGIK